MEFRQDREVLRDPACCRSCVALVLDTAYLVGKLCRPDRNEVEFRKDGESVAGFRVLP